MPSFGDRLLTYGFSSSFVFDWIVANDRARPLAASSPHICAAAMVLPNGNKAVVPFRFTAVVAASRGHRGTPQFGVAGHTGELRRLGPCTTLRVNCRALRCERLLSR